MANTPVSYSSYNNVGAVVQSSIKGHPNNSVAYWTPDSSVLQNLGFVDPQGFYTFPTPWDILFVAGNPLPGLCRVERCMKKLKLQTKARPGSDGASQTFLGYNPVLFDFEIYLWTAPQLAAFCGAVTTLFPGKGKPITKTTTSTMQTLVPNIPGANFTPATASSGGPNGETVILTTQPTQVSMTKTVGNRPIPVTMQHPVLQLHNVDSVIVLDMDGPIQWKHHNDIFVVKFKTEQYLPPKNINVTTPVGPLPTIVTQNLSPPQNGPVSPAANGAAAPNSSQPTY